MKLGTSIGPLIHLPAVLSSEDRSVSEPRGGEWKVAVGREVMK
jgi:hypothetical protein